MTCQRGVLTGQRCAAARRSPKVYRVLAVREAVLYHFLLLPELPEGLPRAPVRGLPSLRCSLDGTDRAVGHKRCRSRFRTAGLGVEASSAHAGPPLCGAHAAPPSCMLPRREMPLPPRPMTQHTNQWTGRERLLRWQLSGKHSRSTSTSSSSTIVLHEVKKLYLASGRVCSARARTRRPSSLLSNHMYAETTSSAGSHVQSTTRECAGSSERLR